jgi:hypothetical protein
MLVGIPSPLVGIPSPLRHFYASMAGNFHYIPEEQKKLILTMSLRGMSNHGIEIATGIKTRTIRRLIKLWKLTGQVVKHPLEGGRPRALTSQVSVCFAIRVLRYQTGSLVLLRVLSSRSLILLLLYY